MSTDSRSERWDWWEAFDNYSPLRFMSTLQGDAIQRQRERVAFLDHIVVLVDADGLIIRRNRQNLQVFIREPTE